ncbi:CHRD domain-containing protein [Devosia limi]|uniref:CHRD domain-containing protein n=1 Tax=Devosia limi DSM 17137 TaxID=1121477 RepID=A0A1M4XE25_9HYPH|nr:CHRD domain-containing protein [Devosia limi]SHE91570.1 CHRD domain-containing protein [Devosia limi DSM 17137]
MTIRIASLAALSLAGLMLASAPAYAEIIDMSAMLNGASEVPATDSAATGELKATYDTDTMELKWTITYDGLTGEPTAAHFHGPADATANASPTVPIEGALASPIEGTATLTEEQAGQLQEGMWYFNIHTAAHPDGEIRGQVTAAAM